MVRSIPHHCIRIGRHWNNCPWSLRPCSNARTVFSKPGSRMNNTHELQQVESPVLAPASRPRLGFLGVGWIGQHRLQALVRSGLVEVVAIADPVQMLAEQAARVVPGAVVLTGI